MDSVANISAVANGMSALVSAARLPHNVFSGGWEDYFFIEPFLLFQDSFIHAAKMLLEQTGASVIAVINLDDVAINSEATPLFIDQSTAPEDYIAELNARRAP